MDEIKTEISEPINAEVSEHSQPSADSNEVVEKGDNLSSTLEDTSGDSQIIQIESNVDELNSIIDKLETIIQDVGIISENVVNLSENYYNQQIYSRSMSEYFGGLSVLVVLLIVARLLYKLFNNIFFGGV